jgi:Protein of unknown function (DUF2735)
MATSISPGSARIYEFPRRGRFAARDESQHRTNLEAQAAVATVGGCWYHDAAIAEEAERSRSN